MTDIARALHDLLNEPQLPLDEAIARHVTDGIRQRTDGEWVDRRGFAEHIAHLRAVVAHVDIDVREELVDGRLYADRHRAHTAKHDGGRVTQEVYLFGTRARDGRLDSVEETTLMLAGAEEDRGIGSAR